MESNERVLILDFGGQYSQLIARRIRELNVFCEIMPYTTPVSKIKEYNPNGIIFSGGPSSVYSENAPSCDEEIFKLGIPVFGICYGMQLMSYQLGGKVERAEVREYGKTTLFVDKQEGILKGVPKQTTVWMSHGDSIKEVPDGFEIIAHSGNTPAAAIVNKEKKLYGVQYHPEVIHTVEGQKMLENFLYNICGCSGEWTMKSFIDEAVENIKKTVGNKKVLCALSGGIDSSVSAALVHKAIGDNLTCIFVDHGLLRKNEAESVERIFSEKFNMNLIKIDAADRFLEKLEGVTDPEDKRKIIGEEFIRVFEEQADKLGHIDYLVQGTLYPDVIESGTDTAAVIKSHHNVGGLPEDMQFELIEPLRELFKDEVRTLAEELGLPDEIVWRQPFPGPGLAVRVLGKITRQKLEILRDADAIVREEIKRARLHKEIWQYFAVLPNMKSVGVMGDERTYAYPIILRAVTSSDGMTADWARIPYDILERISTRVVNEVEHVNRLVYDVTSKPPGTIEWE